MFTPGWIDLLLLLTVPPSLCSLDIVENDREVTCSQGLWKCTMKDGTPFDLNSVQVTGLSAQVKLCRRGDTYALCLLLQVDLSLNEVGEDEGNSGLQEDDGTVETKDDEAKISSVTVCYKTPQALPMCKTVEFIVNPVRASQHSTAQVSMTVINAVISYENILLIDSPYVPNINFKINVPSLTTVCNSNIKHYVQECNAPKIRFLTNKSLNQVELSFLGSNSNRLPEVCVQNERSGKCRTWNRKPIPLDSVTPCTCFQAWNGEGQTRSASCPFKNNTSLRSNMMKNITLSVSKDISDSSTRMGWNVSAPCRLEGELWPCKRTQSPSGCTEIKGFRQKLGKNAWIQNIMGLWEKTDVFSRKYLDNNPCVMLKIQGMEYEMGPFCYNSFGRWRWSLFAVAVMLLLSLTLLLTLCLRDFVKKSVCSWRSVKIHKAHMLVLSPPDSEGEVASTVCNLGTLLCSSGFSVTVDQWSRRGQFSSGPLPWTHCQLLSMDSTCERVVLVLTPKAVDRAQKWSSVDSPISDLQEESPYSDVFRASLFAIQAYKSQDRARERFVLVTFDSQWTEEKICCNKLPEILQGLPLFHFPSQTKALLSDLCVGRAQRWSDKAKRTFSSSKYNDCAAPMHSKTWETETRLL